MESDSEDNQNNRRQDRANSEKRPWILSRWMSEDDLKSSPSWEDFTQYRESPLHIHPVSLDGSTCQSNAFRSFLNGFILAYGLRTGLSLAIRILTLARSQPRNLLSLHHLLSEKNLVVRVDAVRLGLAVGGFLGIFNAVYCFLRNIRKKLYKHKEDQWNSIIAGGLAGLSLLFLEKDARRTPALYLLARLIQCLYNLFKSRGWWHFWGSSWEHGDSLLFIITSAQVMYAYVMRPETLPESYYKFIVRTGPIDEIILQAVRNNNRGKPIDLNKVLEFCKVRSGGAPPPISDTFPSIIPCSALHPQRTSCAMHNWDTFANTAKKIFPLYASLTFVPMIALQFFKFIRKPFGLSIQGLLSALRSTTFLASFVALYQTVICIQRKFVTKDHRFIYFLAGIISSFSILIEKKSRRSELALYTLPRALDSAYIQLCDRKWMAGIPYGEVILFCISTSGLMYFFHHEQEHMSPLLATVLRTLFRKKIF